MQTVRYELERFGAAQSIEVVLKTNRGHSVQAHQTIRDDLARVSFPSFGDDVTRFAFDIVVPPFPTHMAGDFAWSSVWLEVRARTGARFLEFRFPLHVCEPLGERRADPAVARTTQAVELALGLAATRVTGGTTLVGQVTIAGLTADTRVGLEVLGSVRVSNGAVRLIKVHDSKLHVPLHAAATGVPFTIQLPRYLAPTLAIDTHQIQYEVRARHKQWRGTTTVSLPLHVVDAFPAPARIRPPNLGERRIEQVFEQIAERGGWNLGPSVDADPELGTMMPWVYGAHGGVVMRLGYAFRPDGSTYLVSRVRYQPLELGFSVTRTRANGMVMSGISEWDHEHAAIARDHISVPRATEILTTVVPALAPLGTLVRWDDDWLVCEREVADVELALVDEIATALRLVARAIAQAIRSNELPVGPYR